MEANFYYKTFYSTPLFDFVCLARFRGSTAVARVSFRPVCFLICSEPTFGLAASTSKGRKGSEAVRIVDLRAWLGRTSSST